AALQVLAGMQRTGETLAATLGDLQLFPQKMINVPLAPGQDWQQHAGLQRAYASVQAELQGRGRALIRASGTEPKLRLMVEADDLELTSQCAQRLADSLA